MPLSMLLLGILCLIIGCFGLLAISSGTGIPEGEQDSEEEG